MLPYGSNLDIDDSRMPMGWANLYYSEHEWKYETEPQEHAANRIIHLPRGKFLGGSSGMNGTLMVRGTKHDYDQWAEMGNEGWAWNDVLPLFKKSEKFTPTEGFDASTDYHGQDGPLRTSVHPFAPISSAFLESFIDKGSVYKEDMFSEGESEGAGHAVRTVYGGVRTSGADFVNLNPPSNLSVLYNTMVARVLMDPIPTGGPADTGTAAKGPSVTHPTYIATGVEAHIAGPGKSDAERTLKVIKARKEIILSAGSYNSPMILMHSGVGPRQHIEDVGIEGGCKLDLPYVGSNLEDHLVVFNVYELNKNMTNDHLFYPPGALDASLREWHEKKTGVMGKFAFGPFAFLRIDERLRDKPEWKEALAKKGGVDPTGQLPAQPHIEYISSELYIGPPQTAPTKPDDQRHRSLALCRPFAPPIIDHAYLSNPLDLAVLAEGTKLVHEIVMEGKGTKDHVRGPWPADGLAFPNTDEGWKQYVREHMSTAFHPACTVKMGPESDPTACVDPRLRVRGVKNLRVADISILPKLNNGHTQAPAYMVGEKAAILILEDNKP
ncbi:alcohol oxidase [Clavulina sp. PMI_390]|nr:alcohol oxidase [Clavulina sp. PMI_390]